MMGGRDHSKPLIGKSTSGDPVPARKADPGMSYELQKSLHVLGPRPKQALETFVDLGLSDVEIARYFRIATQHVGELRRIWGV